MTTASRRPDALGLRAGESVAGYVVVGKLGEGGMGAVYEARHAMLGRHFAVKVMHPRFAEQRDFARRFLEEARVPAHIGHPDVAEVFECGRLPDGTLFLVMELLRGESLRAKVTRQGRIDPRHALKLARQITTVVVAAHARNVVHRDLKPDNVMLVPDPARPCEERVKLLDFGIARVVRERESEEIRARVTQTDQVLGTPRYMAPEQCRGAKHVDGKADVYALGAMFYELLAGRAPFQANSTGELMLQHMQAAPRPLREIDPALPAGFTVLIHAMLNKSPDERPSAPEVLAELDRIADSLARRDRRVAASPPRDDANDHPKLPSYWDLFNDLSPFVKLQLAIALVGVLVALAGTVTLALRFHLPL